MPRRPGNLPAAPRAGRAVAHPQGVRGGLPANVMEAMARKTAAIERATAGLRDEYRSEDIRAAANHQRLQDAGRPALAPPARQGVAGLLAGGDGLPAVGAAPAYAVPAPAQGGLPALVGAQPQGGDLPNARGWQRLRDIAHGPYMQNEGIRAFMRRQHRQWPCFARHERMWEAQGRDPLGMISSIVLVPGIGDPNEAALRQEINGIAAWIRANGVPIDARSVEHDMFDGYTTEIVLATTETKTFLLVREPGAANGFEGMSVHSWDGGTAAYRDGPGREFIEQRARDRAVEAPPQRIAPPPAGLLPARGAEPARRQELVAAPAPQERRVPDDAERKAVLKALPTAASPSIAAASDRLSPLRAAGFLPSGNQEGPCLRRNEEDGTTTVLQGVKGQQLARMEAWTLRSVAQNGDVLSERTIDDPEDALRAPSAGPRP